MIYKILLVVGVIATVYFFFIKKRKPLAYKEKKVKKPSSGSSENTMIECMSCGTYITADDAFIKNGQYFCSKECMEAS